MGIKKSNLKEKGELKGRGLSEISAALRASTREKATYKKAQLRFQFINSLPAGDSKTMLLMQLLHSTQLTGEEERTTSDCKTTEENSDATIAVSDAAGSVNQAALNNEKEPSATSSPSIGRVPVSSLVSKSSL